MSIEFSGERISVPRFLSGFSSLDQAFAGYDGEIGVPLRGAIEIYGPTHSFKSTIAYSLSAILAGEVNKDIAIMDLEGYDPDMALRVMGNTGYQGTVHQIDEWEDEDAMEAMGQLLKESCAMGILDSLSAISPYEETEGEIGERNMGRRAFIMAQFARKLVKIQRFSRWPVGFIYTNHRLFKLGSYQGAYTPGGDVKTYLAPVRIAIKSKKINDKKLDSPAVVEGTVVKNRWGYDGSTFRLVVMPGQGIHPGLTAMIDCRAAKLARKIKGGMVQIKNGDGWEDVGIEGHLLNKYDDAETFLPFVKALGLGMQEFPKIKEAESEN